jgi:subtilase family serine protease
LAQTLGRRNANNKQTAGSFRPSTVKIKIQRSVLQLSWFKNGVRIQLSDKYQSTYSNENASLSIKKAKTEDSGHYTLLAENLQGAISSHTQYVYLLRNSLSFSRLCCFICVSGD